ncbi:MAG: D-alanyl-D-alanine carboxypeptidase/D-alanyl-D-alanine-endopeptidase, partial [Candidatus Sericytochromatia bacterium]|nr:D-alanyl-D-alanine carboxypeptidase/D-alanyl-D-alanine-endopeptidase [Candidatus Tanganyikabacteria bacterium]
MTWRLSDAGTEACATDATGGAGLRAGRDAGAKSSEPRYQARADGRSHQVGPGRKRKRDLARKKKEANAREIRRRDAGSREIRRPGTSGRAVVRQHGRASGREPARAQPAARPRAVRVVRSGPVPPEPLAALLGSMVANPLLAGDQVGLVLLDRDGRTRFAHNADRRFVPASTRKILVTAAALALLGPDASCSTRVLAAGRQVGDRLEGDLVLVGGGDPALDGAGLDDLALQVAGAGIRTVSGALLGDASRFRPAEDYGAGWAADDAGFAYASRVSALVVDRNAASESAASANPAIHTLERFRASLRLAGVTVAGLSRLGEAPEGARPVARRDSPPLRDLVARTNKASDNLYAEVLLRHLAAAATADAAATTAQAGLDAEAAWLGWPREAYRLVDGSGLSRYDLLTPRQIAEVLVRMKDDPDFVASLPVAGVDGTLAGRLAGTRGHGRVRAKTGSMSGISALAGYAGDRYVFAFVVNGHVGPLAPVRALQDAVCLALTNGATASLAASGSLQALPDAIAP